MPLTSHFPFPSFRKFQKETLERIEKALQRKRYVILSAPTGSGKSSLAIAIARHFKNTHILTTQKSLQNQYMTDYSTDLYPMKGKSNYPCAIDSSTSCSKGPCKTHRMDCSTRENRSVECPFYIAAAQAQESENVLHNFASFLYQTRFSKLFETRAMLIVDEAHNVERTLMDFVSFRINAKSLGYVIPMKERIEDYLDVLDDVKNNISDRLKALAASSQTATGLIREGMLNEIEDLEKTGIKIDFFLTQSKDLNNWVYNYELDENGDLKFLEIKPVFISRFAQEFLLRFGEQVILMSATLDPYILQDLGIPENEAEYIEVPSTFPVVNRPIYKSYVGKLNNGSLESLLPAIAEKVKKALAHYPGEKGIIHTHTYRIANYIRAHVPSDRLIFHGTDTGMTREEALQMHLMSNKPTVLVSPSMTEGVDLYDNLSRWQIIVKCPFPYLGDKQIRARFDRQPVWYQVQTVRTISQAYGRSVRSDSDHAETFILDGTFDNLLKRFRKYFPGWVTEAVR